MPAVADLQCGGPRAADRFGIGGRSVTDDDLDARIVPQPCFEGFGLAVGQDVDPLVSDSVDDRGAVSVSAAQGEVVHADHPRDRPVRQRDRQQYPHRGMSGQSNRQRGQHADRSPTGQFFHDRTHLAGQSGRSPLVAFEQPGNLFTESLAALRCRANQSSNPYPDDHHATVGGQVRDGPVVVAVDFLRLLTAA